MAWWFYRQMRGLIFNGMGGISAENLDSGMHNLKVNPEYRPLLYDKLLTLAQSILSGSSKAE